MTTYTVRSGDSLFSIAETLYGDGLLWSHLVDQNPLAECGVLYEGQQLAAPPPPTDARPYSDPHRMAGPLGHLPVKIKLNLQAPALAGTSGVIVGVCGLKGELTIYRQGAVQLGDFSVNRLLNYRHAHLQWIHDKMLEVGGWSAIESAVQPIFWQDSHIFRGWEDRWNPQEIPLQNVELRLPYLTVVGQLAEYRINGSNRAWQYFRPQELFSTATLSLSESNGSNTEENLIPLARILKAACPTIVSPADLWAIARDESYRPRIVIPAASNLHSNGQPEAAPDGSIPTASRRKKAARKKPRAKRVPARK